MFHDREIAQAVPLIVDLDGTLTPADLAMESLLRCVTSNPACIRSLFGFSRSGYAGLKAGLARHDPVDPATLSFRPEVIELIEHARQDRRPVILASAAHDRQARRIACHLNIFDHAIGTRAGANNKGEAKLSTIRGLIGDCEFDYVGDSPADHPIWRAARVAYTVGTATGLQSEQRIGPPRPNIFQSLAKAARPHQWAKNLLAFVPLLTSGLAMNAVSIALAVTAFLCLSLLASGTYLFNDLLDIQSDRGHKTKHKRPLAAGTLSIPVAIVAAGAAILCSLGTMAWVTGLAGLLALSTYLALTLAYSLRIKSAMIADVMALACLYTLRLVIGAVAIGVPLSFWLLLFSTFFFLSLGYLKRYIELTRSRAEGHELLSGRGYAGSDIEIVLISGISSGMVSLLVLVLFANAMSTSTEYATPALLWFLVLPLLYWLNRIWMMARRGQVDGDPVAFAIRDRRSLFLFACLGAIAALAKFADLPAI